MVAVTELAERLTRLEAEVEALKKERAVIRPAKAPWWEQISGAFKDCPEFEEATRLGREWRELQRMEYDTEDTQVTEDSHGPT